VFSVNDFSVSLKPLIPIKYVREFQKKFYSRKLSISSVAKVYFYLYFLHSIRESFHLAKISPNKVTETFTSADTRYVYYIYIFLNIANFIYHVLFSLFGGLDVVYFDGMRSHMSIRLYKQILLFRLLIILSDLFISRRNSDFLGLFSFRGNYL